MKRPTIKDVAKKANVSVTTVSKVLSNHPDISAATKKKVRDVCEEMQYVPNATATFLRKKSTNFVGIIFSDSANPYFSYMLMHMEKKLYESGYYPVVFNTNEDKDKEYNILNELRSINVAGIIITPSSGENVRMLREQGTPFVLASRYIDKDKDNYVIPNDYEAGYLATSSILENAEADATVYFLGSGANTSSYKERISGYKKALMENGMTFDERNTVQGIVSSMDGYNAVERIIRKSKPPYYFVCISDYCAVGVMKCLLEHGLKIPENARVVGMDNIEAYSFAHPLLTTVDTKKEETGEKCVEVLVEIIKSKKEDSIIEDKRIRIQPDIIKKETG